MNQKNPPRTNRDDLGYKFQYSLQDIFLNHPQLFLFSCLSFCLLVRWFSSTLEEYINCQGQGGQQFMPENEDLRNDMLNPEKALPLIKEIIPYVDRITIWLDRTPNFTEEQLNDFCGSVHTAEGPMKYPYKSTGGFVVVPKWRFEIDLFQPTLNAFEFLAENLHRPIEYYINYVELSLDFITDSNDNRDILRYFFEMRWIKQWHVRGKTKTIVRENEPPLPDTFPIRGTTYYNDRRSRVNYLMYSDKPSKVNNEPCCHLEARLKGRKAIEENKVNTLEAYLDSNLLHEFWKKHLNLKTPNDPQSTREIIEETFIKRRRRKRRDLQGMKRHMALLHRIFAYENYSAQVNVDIGKYVADKRKLTETILNTDFLPSETAKVPMIIYTNEQNDKIVNDNKKSVNIHHIKYSTKNKLKFIKKSNRDS